MTVPGTVNPLLLGGGALSLPSFYGFGNGTVSTGTTITITKNGIPANALLIAATAIGQSGTLNTPSGWTTLGTNQAGGFSYRTFYRSAGATPPTSFTFTSSISGYMGAIVMIFTNAQVDTGLISNGAFTGSSGSSANCGSLTLTAPATMVLGVAGVAHGNAAPATPSGFTEISRFSTGGTNSGVGLSLAYKVFTGAVNTGNITFGNGGVGDVYAGGLRAIVSA